MHAEHDSDTRNPGGETDGETGEERPHFERSVSSDNQGERRQARRGGDGVARGKRRSGETCELVEVGTRTIDD